MKNQMVTIVILLGTTFGLAAQAQDKTLLTHFGRICIQSSSYSAAEVLNGISADATDFIKSSCKESEGDLDDSLEIDLRHAGHGCPYGHHFEYTLRIKCQAR